MNSLFLIELGFFIMNEITIGTSSKYTALLWIVKSDSHSCYPWFCSTLDGLSLATDLPFWWFQLAVIPFINSVYLQHLFTTLHPNCIVQISEFDDQGGCLHPYIIFLRWKCTFVFIFPLQGSCYVCHDPIWLLVLSYGQPLIWSSL